MKMFKSVMLSAAALSVACMPVIAAAKEAAPAAQKLSLSNSPAVRAGAALNRGSHASGYKWFWIAAVVAGVTAAVIIATRDRSKSP